MEHLRLLKDDENAKLIYDSSYGLYAIATSGDSEDVVIPLTDNKSMSLTKIKKKSISELVELLIKFDNEKSKVTSDVETGIGSKPEVRNTQYGYMIGIGLSFVALISIIIIAHKRRKSKNMA